MIIVIADDFTGAAEIGGIGLRHGLSVLIDTEFNEQSKADMVIIATDTRSYSETEAKSTIHHLTREILKLNPELIYKKIDSALRGNIGAEITAQMEAMNLKKAVIIAANPVFKRAIREGIYTIDDIPLNKTSFSRDPEYPATSSSVQELVSKNKYPVIAGIKPGNILPETGLIVGDVNNYGDLETWASKIDNTTLIAGASGFFNALLSYKKINKSNLQPFIKPFGENALYVLGSTFPKNDNFLDKINGYGYYISNMPSEIYFNRNFSSSWLEYWANDIIQAFNQHKKVFMTISYDISNEAGISERIKNTVGNVIQLVIQKIKLDELIIEGGGTTSVILKHLNVKQLVPFYEIETGIIRMKMEPFEDLILTTKPGSYIWPDSVWLSKEINYIN